MKKLLSWLLAIGLIAAPCLVYAHSIAYDPSARAGTVTVPVYNDSGGALAVGDLVIWDVDATETDAAYVTTTTTADTQIVAGVVWPSAIAANSEGSIAIWGYAKCDIKGAVPAGSPICSSGTAKHAGACTDNDGAFAILLENTRETTGNCLLMGR